MSIEQWLERKYANMEANTAGENMLRGAQAYMTNTQANNLPAHMAAQNAAAYAAANLNNANAGMVAPLGRSEINLRGAQAALNNANASMVVPLGLSEINLRGSQSRQNLAQANLIDFNRFSGEANLFSPLGRQLGMAAGAPAATAYAPSGQAGAPASGYSLGGSGMVGAAASAPMASSAASAPGSGGMPLFRGESVIGGRRGSYSDYGDFIPDNDVSGAAERAAKARGYTLSAGGTWSPPAGGAPPPSDLINTTSFGEGKQLAQPASLGLGGPSPTGVGMALDRAPQSASSFVQSQLRAPEPARSQMPYEQKVLNGNFGGAPQVATLASAMPARPDPVSPYTPGYTPGYMKPNPKPVRRAPMNPTQMARRPGGMI